MVYKGKIEKLDNIVISDPCYEKNVWCRYERENIKEKNWVVTIELEEEEEEIDGDEFKYINLNILLSKNEFISNLDDIEISKTSIGMDTACIAFGINENADKIINSRIEYELQSNCSLPTASDGMFGEVTEFKKNDELKCIYIEGTFDGDILTPKEILDYVIKQFEIVDLKKDDVDLSNVNTIYKNGCKVEIKECSIQDENGTTMIRNSNYKSGVEGKELTVINSDGTEENVVLKSYDTLVSSPIIVQVKSKFFDYETGYHYKGEIINDDLIKELNKLEIINSEKPIISFSEFSVVNVIDNDVEKEGEEL